MMRLGAILLASALALAVSACGGGAASQGDRALVPKAVPRATASAGEGAAARPAAPPASGVTESPETPLLEVSAREWRVTNFRRYAVDPREILPGGLGKNGIAPIYEPLFVSIAEAETWEWMTPTHPVAVVERNGDARAYPLGILTYHEVVNDIVGGEPLLVTHFPLSYTTLGFKRTASGKVLAFGTTGNVRNSNLVMWDDATESWWQQATGEAILGDLAGARLEFVPMFTTSLAEFKATYPAGRVLSPDSASSEYWGFYGKTVYLGYDAPNNPPFLFRGPKDERLPPMERVLVVEVNKVTVAFPFTYLAQQRATQTSVEGQPVVLFWKPGTLSALDKEEVAKSRDVGSAAAFDPQVDGRLLTFSYRDGAFRDAETGSTWSLLGLALGGPLQGTWLRPLGAEIGFWFMWAAFRPDIRVYRPGTAGATR